MCAVFNFFEYHRIYLIGRHTGTGKRRGTREARFPSKILWMRKMRVLRRMLKKYRDASKIGKHLYVVCGYSAWIQFFKFFIIIILRLCS
jgi:ribosomal protein L19E